MVKYLQNNSHNFLQINEPSIVSNAWKCAYKKSFMDSKEWKNMNFWYDN